MWNRLTFRCSSVHCSRTASLANTLQEQMEWQKTIPRFEPGPQGCCQGRGCRDPLHTHELPSCWDLGTPRAPQPHNLLVSGFAWPCSPFPILPTPGVLEHSCLSGRRALWLLLAECFTLATSSNNYFFTQVRTKISLSPIPSSCYRHHPGHASVPWPLSCHSAQIPASAIAVAVAATCSG